MPRVTQVDGGGTAICDICDRKLDYSWRVTLDNGTHQSRCSLCLLLDTPAVAAE